MQQHKEGRIFVFFTEPSFEIPVRTSLLKHDLHSIVPGFTPSFCEYQNKDDCVVPAWVLRVDTVIGRKRKEGILEPV